MIATPPKIYHWLNTPLSIARFAGGCTIEGKEYWIDPDDPDDPDHPLVRVDVLAKERAEKRKAAKAAKADKAAPAADADRQEGLL